MKKTVCVDLDGTLITYGKWKGITHFGRPRPGAKAFMEDLRQRYHVIVYTTRCKKSAQHGKSLPLAALRQLVAGFLDKHNIPYDEIYTGQGKPFAVAYVDDRSVKVPKNPAPSAFIQALEDIEKLNED